MKNKEKFNVSNFLVLNLAKEINEGETIVQGTSTFIPLISTALAMQKKKINLIGNFSSNPKITPKIPSTFCFENYKDEKSYLGLSKFLDLLQSKQIHLEFLRPAQVDRFGNINNTVIGKHNKPRVRLPGGMGVDDVMHFIKKIILYVPDHNNKSLVKKVDFITASGWNKGKGPDKIVTNMCIFEFINKKITLTEINPLYSIKEVKKKTGFKFKVASKLKKMLLVDNKTKKLINKLDPLSLRDLEIREKREQILDKFR